MSDFGTCLPIGVLSSPRPKYPVNGFSQMTCFPACMASTIIGACSAGGVQMSTTSTSLSASRCAEIAIGRADLVLLGELEDMVAARGNRRHLRVDAIDALIGVHVQFGDEAASDQAYSHFRHRRAPSVEEASYRNDGTRSCRVGQGAGLHTGHSLARCSAVPTRALSPRVLASERTASAWAKSRTAGAIATPRRAILPTLQAEERIAQPALRPCFMLSHQGQTPAMRL